MVVAIPVLVAVQRDRIESRPIVSTGPAPSPVMPDEPRGMRPRTVVVLGGSILTVVAAGAGVFFVVKAGSAKKDAMAQRDELRREGRERGLPLRGECPPPPGERANACEGLTEKWERVDRLYDTATGAFVAAGVLLAGTAATYVLWRERTSGSSQGAELTWFPTISPSEQRIGLQLRF